MFEEDLFRGLLVGGVIALIGLAIWAWPLSDSPSDAPTTATFPATEEGRKAETAVPSGEKSEPPSATASSTPSPTALPTITPLFSPTPTFTPTFTPSPVPSSTPTPSPSRTPTPSKTPTPPAEPSPTRDAVEPSTANPLEEVSLAGRVEQSAYFSPVTGKSESYRVYLPPAYDGGDRRYPVLYLLHGWPYDESHWDDLGVDEVADTAIVSGTLPSFIIVMPGVEDALYVETSGGDHSFEGQLVNDLIPHIDDTYRTWADGYGRAIGGISRGGVWSLEIGFRNAELFEAVGAHSPALSANMAPPVYDPFNLMTEPGVADLRVYLSAGDTDWAWSSTEALHQALVEQGVSSHLAVHEGGHRSDLWIAHLYEYLAFYTAMW